MDFLTRGLSTQDFPMFIDIDSLATLHSRFLRRIGGVEELGPRVPRDAQPLLRQELAQAFARRGSFLNQAYVRSGADRDHKGKFFPNPLTSTSVWQQDYLDNDMQENHQVFVNRDCPTNLNPATIPASYDPAGRRFNALLAASPMWKQEHPGQEPPQAADQGNFGQTEAANAQDPDALAMMNHQNGECRPCVFYFHSACPDGPSCKYCHVPHPKSDYQRIRLSKSKLAKLQEFRDRPFISFKSA